MLSEKTVKKYLEMLSSDEQKAFAWFRKNQDKVDWDWISKYQPLSEPFIREFQDKVNWDCIFKYQPLSEPFIREFQDKVEWY
jgi:hypothetical protein